VLLLLEIDARIREVLQVFSKSCHLAAKRTARALTRGESIQTEKEGEEVEILIDIYEAIRNS
jgi:hypothetical protein